MTVQKTSVVTCDELGCDATGNGGEFGNRPDGWVTIWWDGVRGPLQRQETQKDFCGLEHAAQWCARCHADLQVQKRAAIKTETPKVETSAERGRRVMGNALTGGKLQGAQPPDVHS